jgi:hypothetical protein
MNRPAEPLTPSFTVHPPRKDASLPDAKKKEICHFSTMHKVQD